MAIWAFHVKVYMFFYKKKVKIEAQMVKILRKPRGSISKI